MPLVEPLPLGVDSQTEELARFFQTTLGFPPNSVLTMQRRPAIARAFIELNKAVMTNEGRLTSELKRLVALISSASTGCRYCQAHTALAAERFGSTDARLADLWTYQSSAAFTDAEKAAFDLTIAASAVPNAVDADVIARVRAHWDDGEIVELMGVIALFGYLNRWNDSMGTTLEAGALEAGERRLAGCGWGPGKHSA